MYREESPLSRILLFFSRNPSVDGATDTTESNRDRIIMIVSATIASEITDGINISVVIGSHCEWKRTTVEMQLWNFAPSRTLVARWNMTPRFVFLVWLRPVCAEGLAAFCVDETRLCFPPWSGCFLGCLMAGYRCENSSGRTSDAHA